jgi:hypothetical protein
VEHSFCGLHLYFVLFSLADLEIRLRDHCQCIKVVARSLNGAHLMVLPASKGEVTIAVRVYYGNELPPHASSCDSAEHEPELEELGKFQKFFALTVIFFILQPHEKEDQLQHRTSFVRRVQHLLTTVAPLAKNDPAKKTTSTSQKKPKTASRVWIVPSSEVAVEALMGVADALHPHKRQRQRAWYEYQQQQAYVPQSSPTSTTADKIASTRVQEALNTWAVRNGIPLHEMKILQKSYGSLEALVDHAKEGLPGAAVSDLTARLVCCFFHGTDPQEWDSLRSQVYTGMPSSTMQVDQGPAQMHEAQYLFNQQSLPQGQFSHPAYFAMSHEAPHQAVPPLGQQGTQRPFQGQFYPPHVQATDYGRTTGQLNPPLSFVEQYEHAGVQDTTVYHPHDHLPSHPPPRRGQQGYGDERQAIPRLPSHYHSVLPNEQSHLLRSRGILPGQASYPAAASANRFPKQAPIQPNYLGGGGPLTNERQRTTQQPPRYGPY